MSAVGLAGTGYLVATRKPAAFWLPSAYFTAMEILQALSYPVVDQCDLTGNQVVTVLGFVHIPFHPLFFNILCLFFPAPRLCAGDPWAGLSRSRKARRHR